MKHHNAEFWMGRLPLNAIEDVSRKYLLEPDLIMALVVTESGGNPGARRVEHWKYFFRIHHFAALRGITPARERQLQRTALGLTQIVGATAREMGYTGDLEDLADPFNPALNLEWGCKKLAGLIEKYSKVETALAAYNGGTPRRRNGKLVPELQAYANKVMGLYEQFKILRYGRGTG